MDSETEVGREEAAGADTVRVLLPLRLPEGPTGEGEGRGAHVGIALDVETTGLEPAKGKIIELAMRRFRYDRAGVITDIDRPYDWRQDPGEPLDPEIVALTGICDLDLVGEEIDELRATRLLKSASFVVAHNSTFDRRWVEDQLADARGLNWCCSMTQVDWRARGFESRILGYLLVQHGFYHCGHRASADVDALIQMLRHRDADGRTALTEMIERGSRPSWIVRATGAHIDCRDALRERGYRWDPDPHRKVWWREVADRDLSAEQCWLSANVYSINARPRALQPEITRITASNRFL